jgi:altronate dehydratase small subunit
MKIDAILLSPEDNVATALDDLSPGRQARIGAGLGFLSLRMAETIPYGHKFAMAELAAGVPVIKHGEVIGRTTHDIARGAHAHVHNIESLRGRGDLEPKHDQ